MGVGSPASTGARGRVDSVDRRVDSVGPGSEGRGDGVDPSTAGGATAATLVLRGVVESGFGTRARKQGWVPGRPF